MTEFGATQRGDVRDLVLSYFASGLRNRVNPQTGALFTEDEIAAAIQPDSRWYQEASGIDDLAIGDARREAWLLDQLQIDRASTEWLERYHAPLWSPEGRLGAARASGTLTVRGTPGVYVQGSTTVPDFGAYWGRIGSVRYQVYQGAEIDASGTVTVSIVAMDAGSAGNAQSGSVLSWSQRHPSMDATATTSDLTGGVDVETDYEWAQRMIAEVRAKQGGGNDPQQRSWARRASNAIEDAFIYPTAMYAGSLLIAITQKRAGSFSPTARIASLETLRIATAFLVPPGSPVEPSPPRILVVTPTPIASDIGIRLSMATGTSAGFADADPWPRILGADRAVVTDTVADATDFGIYCPFDSTLPGDPLTGVLSGDSAPQLMVWRAATSSFERLAVNFVEDAGSGFFNVTVSSPVSLNDGDTISPYIPRHEVISDAVRGYFDERGPGEIVDLDVDIRGGRCARFPDTSAEYPHRVGAELATRVIEGLGGAASDATVPLITADSPGYPASVATGPRMLVLGQLAIGRL